MDFLSLQFKRKTSAAIQTFSKLKTLPLVFLHCLVCFVALNATAKMAQAAQITYGFGGNITIQAIDYLPIMSGDPFLGYLQYETTAPLTDDTAIIKTYSDPNGFLFAGFSGANLIGIGLEIAVTRINIGTFFNDNSIIFRSNNIIVEGTTEPIANMSFTVGGTAEAISDFNIPEILDESLIARFGASSPDMPPPSGMEPPRTGFMFAQGVVFVPISNVPEPATYLLIGLGLFGSMLVAGRRSR